MKFATILLPLELDSQNLKLREGLIEAFTKLGSKLMRNPRICTGKVLDIGREIWQMLAGETKFEVVVSEGVVAGTAHQDDALTIRFCNQSDTMKLVNGCDGEYTLLISNRVNADCLLRLANQIVADLVVNGRITEYSKGKEHGTGHRSNSWRKGLGPWRGGPRDMGSW